MSTLYGTAASDNERTEHFVNNFYLGARGTNATSTELQQQSDALNAAAAQGLSQVKTQAETFGRSLFASQVNDGSLSNAQFVTNLYEAFLQRGPDSGGLTFWSGQASVGAGRQSVLNSFATCGGFYELAGTLYREAFWLVSDQLDTPRMVVDKSGTLASVKRHDYLPFGEEIGGPQVALIGGRTAAQGYTSDTVRQHFTGYEADGETGLNFAQARYQSNLQGRFTSVDPLGASATVADPQSFNRYSYVNNNPTNLTDPSGMMTPNPATGIVQTDDESYARTLQGSSDAAFQHGANKDAAAGRGGTVEYIGNRASYVSPTENAIRQIQASQETATSPTQTNAVASINIVGGDPLGARGPGRAPVSAVGGPHNTVIITYTDGSQEVRSGGTRNWRNNNPGNIRPGYLRGEIGKAGGFAVFPTEDVGDAAIIENLGRPLYQSLTVSDAIFRWAPPLDHNNTAAYQAFVQRVTGINGQTRMNTLTGDQLRSVANAIRVQEGWAVGTVTRRP